jgi:transcription initiation factor TFIIIB Brf1 subunit/transcription initiation factor TFIIB
MYNTATTSPASKDYYLDQVLAYLKGQTSKSALPKALQETAENLQKELVNTKKIFGELLPGGDLKKFYT